METAAVLITFNTVSSFQNDLFNDYVINTFTPVIYAIEVQVTVSAFYMTYCNAEASELANFAAGVSSSHKKFIKLNTYDSTLPISALSVTKISIKPNVLSGVMVSVIILSVVMLSVVRFEDTSA